MASRRGARELEAFELSVAPGLVEDDTGFKVGQAGFVAVDGVRPFRGGMETVRGFESYNTDTFDGICRGLLVWQDNNNLDNIAVGTHTGLWVEVGGLLEEITPGIDPLLDEDGNELLAEDDETLVGESPSGPVDGYGGAGYGTGGYGEGGYGTALSSLTSEILLWSFGQYGQNLIANPRGWGIYRWQNDTDQPATLIPNSPANCASILVTDRHIIAYGCSEVASGTFNPRCVRWCDFEDIEDWTPATDSNAGEFVIDNTGRIVRAIELGSAIYVFTNDGVYLQQFTGNPNNLYFFQRIADGCGLIGQNAITVQGQTAYWMAPDRKFWMLPFGGAPQRLVSPTARDVSDNLAAAQDEKVYASARNEFNEVRFYYPDARDGLECSRYVSYNLAEGRWSAGMYARTAEIDKGTDQYPISAGTNGILYLEEKGFSGNGAAVPRSARTGFFYLKNGGRVLMLRRLWPDFDDWQGNISLTVYSKLEPNGAETTHGPYVIRPSDTVVDLGNICGALFALEWSCNAAPSFWRMGKITLNGVQRGRGLR